MRAIDQQELARYLGVSDRRIRQLEADHVITRYDGEPPRYHLDINARRYRIYVDHDIDTACRAVEEAAAGIDDLLKRLREERSIQKRRRTAQNEGYAIGRLYAAMDLANAMMSEHARDMAGTFTKFVVERAVNELFDLCEWRLP